MRASTSFISPILTAGLIAAGIAIASQPVAARDGVNAAILGGAAAGVLGGVAAGAILNGGQGAPPPAYAPPPPRRVYVEPESTETIVVRERRRGPVCHMERRKVWFDDDEYTYKRVEVCE